MKRIRITKCSNPDEYWYRDRIGNVLLIDKELSNGFIIVKTADESIKGSIAEGDYAIIPEETEIMEKPTKISEGKLFYEIDWNFIIAMAKRMEANKKNKYERFGWKKGVDIEELKQALMRHLLPVMEGNYYDETEYGHLEALALNSMLMFHELNRIKKI